jgi:hypothetical protein
VDICYIAPSLRLFVPNSLTVYHRSFFPEGSAPDVFLWFGLLFCGDYIPTAPTAPFLRVLVPSGSPVGCEPVQVYHHHSTPKVPLDSVYHIINLGDYVVWTLPREMELGRFPFYAGWAIEPHPVALAVTCAVG